MKSRLLDMLICPACLPEESGLGLEQARWEGDDLVSGVLVCSRCQANNQNGRPARAHVGYRFTPIRVLTECTPFYLSDVPAMFPQPGATATCLDLPV